MVLPRGRSSSYWGSDLMFNALDRPPNAIANRLAAVRSDAIFLRQGICAR